MICKYLSQVYSFASLMQNVLTVLHWQLLTTRQQSMILAPGSPNGPHPWPTSDHLGHASLLPENYRAGSSS